jgi:3',5'-cyclic AMP phosphodiesterase CpdA
MSKVFVIPDVHLKPWMFEKASELMLKGAYDAAVMLGDLVDDWKQEKNLDLYNETFDAAITFVSKHKDTFWCYGNHDVSYLWNALESGFSYYARKTVVKRIQDLKDSMPPENCAFIHKIDNVLFSHAGLTQKFVLNHFDEDQMSLNFIIAKINRMGKLRLWNEDSPIWARPQFGEMRLYPQDVFQVVGHTPVRTALEEGNLLTLDNFSTYPDGRPIGDERFVRIDTVEKKWEFVE